MEKQTNDVYKRAEKHIEASATPWPLVSDVVENRTICGTFLADGSSLSQFWRGHKWEAKNQSTEVRTLD